MPLFYDGCLQRPGENISVHQCDGMLWCGTKEIVKSERREKFDLEQAIGMESTLRCS